MPQSIRRVGGSRVLMAVSSTPSDGLSINRLVRPTQNAFKSASIQFKLSLQEAKSNPWKYLSIPIAAAFIGYVTNFIGVKMIFYPIHWRGIPILRWPEQPFGLFGWQGIVPSKRIVMSNRLVDVTLSKLLNIQDIFNQLSPATLASLLSTSLGPSLRFLPKSLVNLFLRLSCGDILRNADNVVDLKDLVVTGLTNDPKTLGTFFQRVAMKELNFLINSGFGFGFLLGMVQMLQWMVYPKDWTLVAGGAVVGYITNWIALKWIFEPLNPMRLGPFVFQGMFLKRQKEVSKDFCDYLCDNVLISQNVWKNVFEGSKRANFLDILQRNLPLPTSMIRSIVSSLRSALSRSNHKVHEYVDQTLQIRSILLTKMNQLSTVEFEKIIHPIFQEDEMTLILAGAVLGALSGLGQVYMNRWQDKRNAERLRQANDGQKAVDAGDMNNQEGR